MHSTYQLYIHCTLICTSFITSEKNCAFKKRVLNEKQNNGTAFDRDAINDLRSLKILTNSDIYSTHYLLFENFKVPNKFSFKLKFLSNDILSSVHKVRVYRNRVHFSDKYFTRQPYYVFHPITWSYTCIVTIFLLARISSIINFKKRRSNVLSSVRFVRLEVFKEKKKSKKKKKKN